MADLPEPTNPTQEFPTHGGGSWSTPSHPSAPSYPMANYPSPRPPEKPRRTVGMVGASVAGISLLVIGLGAGYLIGSGAETVQPVASAAQAAQMQAGGQTPRSASPQPPPAAVAPDAGASGSTGTGVSSTANALGAAVGTVSSINGASFTVLGLDGASMQVTTTNSTRVATLRGSGGVRNLSVGDPVLVKGTGGADGVITADLVIAGAFPDLGSGTS